MAGESNLLRERVIGCEVFGRPADYETGEDPVVRIRAADVRKRLAQFYQSSTTPLPVRIDVPSGSYRAVFLWANEADQGSTDFAEGHTETAIVKHAPAAGPPDEQESVCEASPQWQRWIKATIGVVVILGAVGWFLIPRSSPQVIALQEFWGPWTNSAKPVLIAVGSNAVYRYDVDAMDHYVAEHHLGTQGIEFFIPLPPGKSIPADKLYAASNGFVALGDVAAISDIVATLAHKQHIFQERFPNDISFVELNNNPSVLVGGFNNPMTIEMTKNLRFVLRQRNEIDDTQNLGRRWVLHASTDSHDTEDYAIVTWLPHRRADSPMMCVAGLGQYGTLAAAQFVSNASAISSLVQSLPKDWRKHNLQLILHVKVVDFKPSAVDVVAIAVF